MASEYETSLPNGAGGPYVDASNNGDWLFNFTGGSFAAANTPGGAIAMLTSTGEGDIAEIVGPLAFEADVGPFSVECEIQVETDASSAAAIFFGFTDRKDATEEPAIEDEDGTLETDATDAVGIMLEREQDATFQAVSTANGTDGAQTALTGASDVADDTWVKLRVEVAKDASAKFYINDIHQTLGDRTAAITSSVRMAPVITLDGRAAAVTVWVRNLRAYGPGAE